MSGYVIDSKRFYKRVLDPLRMQEELDSIALEYEENGWKVERGFLGCVILTLNDGQVHFVPDGRGIEMITFQKNSLDIPF